MKYSKIISYLYLLRRTSYRQLIFRIRRRIYDRRRFGSDKEIIFSVNENLFQYDYRAYANELIQYDMLFKEAIKNRNIIIQNTNIGIDNLKWDNINGGGELLVYEINYFDFYKELIAYHYIDPDIDTVNILKIMMFDWIDHSKKSIKIMWDPYPLSKRIWNWIFCVRWLKANGFINSNEAQLIHHSIYQQTKCLFMKLEYDLDNNHLTANGKTLILAGQYFANQRWQKKGLDIITYRINREFNSDGFHDERSMSYHMGAMLDYSEITCLLKKEDDLRKTIFEKLHMMSDALMYIIKPDGYVPLISDTVMGYPCTEGEIINLCSVLLEREDLKKLIYKENTKLIALIGGENKVKQYYNIEPLKYEFRDLYESGNIVIRDDDIYFLFICASFGPVHCPGHNHCDALSINLNYKGKDIFVDSGVYSYDDRKQRRKYKSTSNHSTVAISDYEQFEILDKFRVGRISKVKGNFIKEEGVKSHAKGTLTHYTGTYTHVREIQRIDGTKNFIIKDNITMIKELEAEIIFILANDIEASIQSPRQILLKYKDDNLIIMKIQNGECEIEVQPHEISTCWNKKESVNKLIIKLPFSRFIDFSITLEFQ